MATDIQQPYQVNHSIMGTGYGNPFTVVRILFDVDSFLFMFTCNNIQNMKCKLSVKYNSIFKGYREWHTSIYSSST